MNSKNKPENYSLSLHKKLLLQAALLPGEAAIDSWRKWRESVNIENLDTESYRLLPLLYRNLSASGVTEVQLGRLKGVYRRTWVENQVLIQAIASIISYFQQAKIKTLLLKDAALNLRYYPDNGLRMIHNINLLVHPLEALAAMNILSKAAWRPKGKIPTKIPPFSQALGFENSSNQSLVLRWHLFADGFSQNAEKDFWQNAKLTQIGELETYVLSPTEQLLYVFVEGAFRKDTLSISQLADAAMIINVSPNEIDWNRLIAKAQNHHLVLPLKNMMVALQEILNNSISSSILQEIRNLPISSFETREHQLVTSRNNRVLDRFNLRYFQYARLVDSEHGNLKFLDFPRYLQYIWGLEHLWQVPYQATIRGIRRYLNVNSTKACHLCGDIELNE